MDYNTTLSSLLTAEWTESFSSTSSSDGEETTTEDLYEYGEGLYGCAEYYGLAYENTIGGVHAWNGMPVRGESTVQTDPYVIAALVFFGLLSLALSISCFYILYRNPLISWAVKCYLFFDNFCRFFEAVNCLFLVHCVITWWCVNTTGYPFNGIFFNSLITSIDLGMLYSMQLLGNALSLNRVFAVFFNGRYYKTMESFAFPHALISWLLPIAVYLFQMGNIINPLTGYICYGGWWFSPQEYANMIWFTWAGELGAFLSSDSDKILYGIFGITLLMDAITLWRVRKLTRLSERRKRADIRLSIMLMVTHVVTVTFLFGNFIANHVIRNSVPIIFFSVLEIVPFTGHAILTLIVILFNIPPKSKTGKAANVTVTNFGSGRNDTTKITRIE